MYFKLYKPSSPSKSDVITEQEFSNLISQHENELLKVAGIQYDEDAAGVMQTLDLLEQIEDEESKDEI